MAIQTQPNDQLIDTSAFAAAVASVEENSFTILSSDLMLKGDYIQDGDDLLIRGDLGEEIRVEGYFSGDIPPTLETPAGAILRPETVDRLLVNNESIDVAGPAGTIAIPDLLGDPIGTIDEIGGDGNVTAKGTDGIVRTLQAGDPVYQDDLIETVGRSFANVRMLDDTSFQLGKETRAIIENYNYTPGVESGQFEATVVSGFFRYASGRLGGLDKGTHTTIKTPTAQIGVRGSEMEGVIEDDGSSTFVHRDGILDISDANGRGTVTLTEPGMATAVSIRPGAPAPAFQAPDELLRQFEEALPPRADFIVSHEEEGEGAEGELLDPLLAGAEGEGEGDGVLDGEGAFQLANPLGEGLAADGTAATDDATAVNLTPTAANDLLFGTEDEVITGDLAINDTLGDGQHVWTVATGPAHGTLIVNPDGTFSYTPDQNYNGTDSFTYTVRDANGDQSTAQVFINLAAVNDAPEIFINGVLVYTEDDILGGAGNLALGEVDGDNLSGATITINDPQNGDYLEYTSTGNGITGVYDAGSGTLTLSGEASLEASQQALLSVKFMSSTGDPTLDGAAPDRSITWTVTDVTGTSSEPLTATVDITAVNDQPVVSQQTTNVLSTAEGALSQALFAGVTVGPVESGQSITKMVFSVTGAVDGEQEMLVIDGHEIPLVATSSSQSAGSDISYEISTEGGVTIVTLGGDWSSERASEIVGGLQYKNSNLTHSEDGERVIALNSIQDSGGTEYGGVDTLTNTDISTTVTLRAVNNAPTITVTDDSSAIAFSETQFEADAQPTAALFSGVTVDAIETGQNFNSFVLKMEGVVPDDQLVINGVAIDVYSDLSDGSGITDVDGYSVSASAEDEARVVEIQFDAPEGGWDAQTLQSLIESVKFQNSGDDPTAWGNATRTITIHSLQDSGGVVVADEDQDTGFFTISRQVDVTAENDAPTYDAYLNSELTYESGVVNLFGSNVSLSSGEHSQNISQIVLLVSGAETDGEESLAIDQGNSTYDLISLTTSSQGTFTFGGNEVTYQVEEVEVSGATKLQVTFDGDWTNSEATTLFSNIGYQYTGTDTLTTNRDVTLDKVVDSAGLASDLADNHVAVSVSPIGNRTPTFSISDADSQLQFVEGETGGGTAVQLLSSSVAVLPAQNDTTETDQDFEKIVLELTSVVEDDRLVFGDDSATDNWIDLFTVSSNVSVDGTLDGLPPFTYSVDPNQNAGGTGHATITLSASSSSPWSKSDLESLLKSLHYENSGTDPAPVDSDPVRTFSILELWDNGDHTVSNDITAGVATDLFSRDIKITPYNQAPELEVTTLGDARYTALGVEQVLFEGVTVDPVESSQSIKQLVMSISGVGGDHDSDDTPDGDGSTEWLLIGGTKNASDVWEGGTQVYLTAGTTPVAVEGSQTVDYTITVAGTGADRTITIEDSDGTYWSGSELAELIESMRYGLGEDGNPVTLSGERQVSLTSITDDGGQTLVADPTSDNVTPDGTDTATLSGISGSVEVMVEADGGTRIVNINQTGEGLEADTPTTDQSESQYFTYYEDGQDLLSGATNFEIKLRFSGDTVKLDDGTNVSYFDEEGAFELLSYKTNNGDWMKFSIVSASDPGEGTALKVSYDPASTDGTDSKEILVSSIGDIMDGQPHEFTLTFDSTLEDEENNLTGGFSFSLDGGTETAVISEDTELIAQAADFLPNNDSVITVGAPGFTGTIFDLSIATDGKVDGGTGDGNLGHWDMDKIEYSTTEIPATENAVGYIQETMDDVGGYKLVVVDNKENDSGVTVDTLLVNEVIEIPQLQYLKDNHDFSDVDTLYIDLSGNNQDDTSQALNPDDLLGDDGVGINKVYVYGDDGDSLTLDSADWTKDDDFEQSLPDGTTAASNLHHYTSTVSVGGVDKEIDLYVETQLIPSSE